MPEGSKIQAERRRQILQAAVRTFAEKGYHAARVSDIAKEAGVAYGLVYHYFTSKEAVLESVFRETWGLMLAAIHDVEERGGPAPDQLRRVCKIVLRAWGDDPDRWQAWWDELPATATIPQSNGVETVPMMAASDG